MDSGQRKIFAVFFSLTVVILLLNIVLPGNKAVSFIKFTTVLFLFFYSLGAKKQYFEQKVMTAALFFTAVGDYFLNLCYAFPGFGWEKAVYGVVAYSVSYLLLIFAFQKGIKLGVSEFFAAVLVLLAFTPFFIELYPFFNGIVLYFAFFFSIILCYMTWTAICTLFSGYFTLVSSIWIALAAILILISDIGVANSVLNPYFAGKFVAWLENLIWGTFIPAWTLILIVIFEDNLIKNVLTLGVKVGVSRLIAELKHIYVCMLEGMIKCQGFMFIFSKQGLIFCF